MPDERALRVVRGHATDEEIAAVTAVVSALLASRPPGAGQPAAAGPPARSAWLDRAALIGAPLSQGPGAWRRSGRPR
jgi:Acyl-CoA carboxylase epsilon subunit